MKRPAKLNLALDIDEIARIPSDARDNPKAPVE